MKEENISPNLIADFLLCELRSMGEIITNLKLQKLLYYSQSWYLADKNRSLFSEDFQARIHGPVLPSQYYRFKKYEWRPIMEEGLSSQIENKSIVEYLNGIIACFGVETAAMLEKMTRDELPWKEARRGLSRETPSNNIIKKESMSLFYKSLR